MSHFLEWENWMQMAKIFESNYLNDGIISKDFLEGGLAPHLLSYYGEDYRDQIYSRHEKEKTYTPYQHPHIQSLSAEKIWSLFAPEIPEKLAILKTKEDFIDLFNERIDLFLAEKNFPPSFLTQVLRYQENDQNRISADPRLHRNVISLFGYHNLNDWFGKNFVQSIARVVINLAAIAREKGYYVSHEEALTDLLFRSQKTYESIKAHVNLPIEDGYEFFQLYLRQKGLDETTVVQIWQEITLFRRMMQEIGSATLVDTLPIEQFYSYANENAIIELYQMSPELRFTSDEEARLFSTYLKAVAPNQNNEIPLQYGSIEKVEIEAPELVGKWYRLYVSCVDKEGLQAKVSMKETWDWELENWEQLKKVFTQLSLKDGKPFELLESAANRSKIDVYARSQIVESHPEWIDEALKEAEMRETKLFISPVSKKEPLEGVTDLIAFQKILDSESEVIGFTQDQKHYYRILIEERSDQKEILPFREAKDILKPLTDTPIVSFANYLEKYRDALPENALWNIEKKEMKISRANPSFISFDAVMALETETFSPILIDEKEGPYCFRRKKMLVDTTIPIQKWIGAQELLAKELQAQFFEHILSQLCSKHRN